MRHRVPLTLLLAPLLVAGCTGDPAAPTGSSAPTATPSPTAPAVDYTAWQAGRSTPVADPIHPARTRWASVHIEALVEKSSPPQRQLQILNGQLGPL